MISSTEVSIIPRASRAVAFVVEGVDTYEVHSNLDIGSRSSSTLLIHSPYGTRGPRISHYR